MGTDDLPERELYQGLIKLAAGCVHRIRGNRRGMAQNLRGARDRLRQALEGRAAVAGAGATEGGVAKDAVAAAGIDVAALIDSVDRALGALDAGVPLREIEPPPIVRAAGPW